MGRWGYPPEFRRRVLDLIEAGRKVADVARDLDQHSNDLQLAAAGPNRQGRSFKTATASSPSRRP
jgi:transposase-like protein